MDDGSIDMYKLIPAHAGVIPSEDKKARYIKPYPRACGGDPEKVTTDNVYIDLSPRMRG